jgi:hypothetical protein
VASMVHGSQGGEGEVGSSRRQWSIGGRRCAEGIHVTEDRFPKKALEGQLLGPQACCWAWVAEGVMTSNCTQWSWGLLARRPSGAVRDVGAGAKPHIEDTSGPMWNKGIGRHLAQAGV